MENAGLTSQDSDIAALRQTIETGMEAGNWESARARLALLANIGPPSVRPEELDGLRHRIETALVNETDWAASASRWKAVLRECPDEPSLWPFAARCFIQTADLSDADTVLAQIARQHPDNLENWMYYALNAEHQHLWSEAVERWDRVIALRPEDPNLKTLRGDAIWNAEMQALDNALAAES